MRTFQSLALTALLASLAVHAGIAFVTPLDPTCQSTYLPAISANGAVSVYQFCTFSPGQYTTYTTMVHDMQTGVTALLGGGTGDFPSVSPDGRYVLYTSTVAQVPGQTAPVHRDVYLYDRQTGATECVNVSSTGARDNGWAWPPASAMSEDGRYVLFLSNGSTLVSGDTNGRADMFLRDRQAGTTVRIPTAGESPIWQGAAMSADGLCVAYGARANGSPTQIYVWRRDTQTTELVSASPDGMPGDGESVSAAYWRGGVAVSADGRYVAFASQASNLTPDDTNGAYDAFVRDRLLGTTTRISIASGPCQLSQRDIALRIAMDPSGRYVAFSNYRNVFVHDCQTGATIQIGPPGTVLTSWAEACAVTADGHVLLESYDAGLHPGLAYNSFSYNYLWSPDPPITAVGLATSRAGTVPANTPVTLTATPTGGGTCEYLFRCGKADAAGTTWTTLRSYQLGNTLDWTPTTAGTYYLEVNARTWGTYPVTAPGKVAPKTVAKRIAIVVSNAAPLTAVRLSASAGPYQSGTAITFTATPTGGDTVTYLYRLGTVTPSGTTWSTLRYYATGNTYTWTPPQAGTYYIEVVAREQGAAKPAASARVRVIVG